MPDLRTVLFIVAGWVAVSIAVPVVFGMLAARASKKADERRRQSLAVSMQRQRDRAARQRQAFAAVKGWNSSTPRDGGDHAA